MIQQCARLPNSDAKLSKRHIFLSHLPQQQQEDAENLIQAYTTLSGDTLSRTTVLEHDVDVKDAAPIKQHAYQVNFPKRELIKQEVDQLVKYGLAKPSCRSWSSPCLASSKYRWHSQM